MEELGVILKNLNAPWRFREKGQITLPVEEGKKEC